MIIPLSHILHLDQLTDASYHLLLFHIYLLNHVLSKGNANISIMVIIKQISSETTLCI